MLQRRGRCRRCGRCCIEAGRFKYSAKMLLPDEPDWLTLEVLTPTDFPFPCSRIIFDIHTREAICLDHSHKPEVCRRYPLSDVDRLPGCGFSFQEESHASDRP